MIDRFERFSVAISELSRYWHKITTAEMEKYGLKGAHSIYLTTMARFPEGITAARLCELCRKDKSDVSRMMGIMEKNGLVVKEGGYQNRYNGVFSGLCIRVTTTADRPKLPILSAIPCIITRTAMLPLVTRS